MRYVLALILAVATLISPACTQSDPQDMVMEILSPVERQFLADHPVLYMGADKAYPPIVFNDEQGRPIGLAVDFLAEISQILDVKFETKVIGNRTQVMHALKERKIDLTFANRSSTGYPYLICTQPYVYDKGVILVRKGKTFNDVKSISMDMGAGANKFLELSYPKILLRPMESHEVALRALMDGKVDGTAMGKEMVWFYAEKLKFDLNQFEMLPLEYEYQLSFGVHVDNLVLGGIMVKALDAIPILKRREMLHRWLKDAYLT